MTDKLSQVERFVTFRSLTILIFLTFGLSIALANTYLFVGSWMDPWVAAFLVNLLIGGLGYCIWRKTCLPAYPIVAAVGLKGPLLSLLKSRRAPYFPAVGIVCAMLVLIVVSRIVLGDPPASSTVTWTQWGWVLLVPVGEELAFRVGFGELLRRVGGLVWGSYFSVLLFAYVHSLPTIERVIGGHTGLALGPLVLGCCLEILWLQYRKILPLIMLHAACNFTVIGFAWGDKRWLQWLNIFYL